MGPARQAAAGSGSRSSGTIGAEAAHSGQANPPSVASSSVAVPSHQGQSIVIIVVVSVLPDRSVRARVSRGPVSARLSRR